MDEYTAIIHRKNGYNIQSDYQSKNEFCNDMEKNKDTIVWARLFKTSSGEEMWGWINSDMELTIK